MKRLKNRMVRKDLMQGVELRLVKEPDLRTLLDRMSSTITILEDTWGVSAKVVSAL